MNGWWGSERPMQFSLTLVIYLKSVSKEKNVMVIDGVASPSYKVVRHHVLPNNSSFYGNILGELTFVFFFTTFPNS